MATVSGTALANRAFPITAIGTGAVTRPPTVRDTTGLATARGAVGANNSANQNASTSSSAFAARDTGIDGQNGVRLAGDNGALLDLTTSLTVQEAAGQAAGEGEAEDENPNGLTDEEEQQVTELSRVDREVRRHEAAHAAVGGAFAGAPSYTFEQGPDGKLYAVAGQVSIDTGPVDGDPAATIQKLQIVRSAALAPGNPSAQDRSVAAQAEAGIRQAQAELQSQRAEELSGEAEGEVGASEETGAETTDATETDGRENGARQAGFSGADRSQSEQNDRTADLVARVIDIAV